MRRLDTQDVAPRPAGRVVGRVAGRAAGCVAGRAVAAPQAAAGGAARGAGMALACSLLLACALLLAWGGWAWLTRTPGLAVRRIDVRGTTHASQESLIDRSGAMGVNSLALDLAAVRARLLEDPWVAAASVRRVLPHGLSVTVSEREPAAFETLAGERRVLGSGGELLCSGEMPAGLSLPEIRGLAALPEAARGPMRATAAATLHALAERAPALHASAQALDVAEPGRLVLLTDDGPPIWLIGPESVDEAAAWSLRQAGIEEAIDRAAWVDARWRDRLHVMPLAQARGRTMTSTRSEDAR